MNKPRQKFLSLHKLILLFFKDQFDMVKEFSSDTSWQKVSDWYDTSVGEIGHYYHKTLILPGVIRLLDFPSSQPSSLLDLACGQGVLSRVIPSHVTYVGIDASSELIKAAKNYPPKGPVQFLQGDVTQKLPLKKQLFSHAALILALQNIENGEMVFKNVANYLEGGGAFVIVLNHPHYRIPRQSSWKVDLENKIQYRRIDRYMSPMKIPIQAHPGKGKNSSQTWSFHHPLSSYSLWLKNAGFTIDLIEEWCSNKISEGKAAKMENRSRQEIPLFMTILARKK